MVLHTDLPVTGEFSCSDPLVNQLQKNIQWSQRGNFLDVPTDCPQRDERLGGTGDAQVFIRTAVFNLEAAGFFKAGGKTPQGHCRRGARQGRRIQGRGGAQGARKVACGPYERCADVRLRSRAA